MQTLDKTPQISDFIRVIPGDERMGFLPKYLGPLLLRFESRLYDNAERTITGMGGREGTYKQLGSGYWEYATTQTGQPFAYPKVPGNDQTVSMTTYDGYGNETLSAELAGIVVTALTLMIIIQQIAESPRFQDLAETLIDRYHDLLRDGKQIADATGYSQAFYQLTN